ncbi:MAG TPA: DinB family protein [Phnomibacter sp.]|nr:DinB family protein [Phnomibacter sp.]
MQKNEIGVQLLGKVRAMAADLQKALDACGHERYTLPLPLLSGATIGEHTRHIIEFFQCLHLGLAGQRVDYDSRRRDHRIETDKDFAMQQFFATIEAFTPHARELTLHFEPDHKSGRVDVPSNYYRELVYNIEHAIHHMAMIKIGLRSLDIDVDHNFGVASSTIQYRASCAS